MCVFGFLSIHYSTSKHMLELNIDQIMMAMKVRTSQIR